MEKNIPTHDMQTGDLNPYYKELTGGDNSLIGEVKNKIPATEV